MGKLLLVLSVAFFLITTPVLASKDKEKGTQNLEIEIEQEEECDSEQEWKNHGEYVSCVAKLRLGGKVTSEAAKSDIGKKNQNDENDDEDENEPSPSPNASPSASPSASPTTSPSASPSVSPSPVGIGVTSGGAVNSSLQDSNLDIRALIQFLQNLIDSLKKLMTE